jgi:hypothetical protein
MRPLNDDISRHLSHSANNMDSAYPIVDFSKFFDGENIEQEDIVLWFSECPLPGRRFLHEC